MKKAETIKMLAYIASTYPRFEIKENTAEIWHELLEDLPVDVARAAVKRLICQSPFPPSIHEIRAKAADIMTPPGEQVSPIEAWGEVLGAIQRYGMYGEKKAMESMTPQVGQVAKMMGWRDMCMGENLSVTRGQFLKMYAQAAEGTYQTRLLPKNLRALSSGEKQKRLE